MEQNKLESGTYEIIQNRLQKHKTALLDRLSQLNTSRKEVFGSVETKLIANNRINTENSCIARDIVTIGEHCIFGYNVHFGLRTEIKLEDVFSVYKFEEGQFVLQSLAIFEDATFASDFTNLYKYYRNTIFSKFAIIGNYLHLVFQLSESVTDIKTFKWLIADEELRYIDNRSEHEFKFPDQHDFQWVEVGRDQHRYGTHAHISILDKVFVETIGGDLTIKIEDNTDDGKGIYNEPVEHKDQTLDDGQYKYAALGNLIAIEIKPFQEASRYFVYNHKIHDVKKIESIGDACIQLPDDQGIIFADGYYLQSGAFKKYDQSLENVNFKKTVVSPNGEDYLYVFYESKQGLFILMGYNVIAQEVQTPIVCNGYTIFSDGSLCYFSTENEQTRHHVIQVWQTPFIKGDTIPSEHTDTLIYKIGNKSIVKAMAECQGLVTLLNKEDSYDGLYDDLSKFSNDIINSYYWIKEPDTHRLDEPLQEINNAANAAIDEFEKVVQLRKNAQRITQDTESKASAIFGKIKSSSFKSINDFVAILSQLRTLRGEVIGLNEVRYVDTSFIEDIEKEIVAYSDKISNRCVQFLLDEKALQPYHERVHEKKKSLSGIKKVIEGKKLEEEITQIAQDLEMLIEIVSNLEIEDTSHSTQIIDRISLIFSSLNELKAGLKNTVSSLGKEEAQADFVAQLKLVDQSIINYLDISSSPEKTDELLNKVAVQLEDLEARFADFDTFIVQIIEKREEVYNAFEARKNSLVEARNKKALALENAAKRILKGVSKKALSFTELNDINGYFAGDLMLNKLRDIVDQLKGLDDIGKAEIIETSIKVAKEDAIRKLKDKQDLYEDGENIIKLGKHKFAVNQQNLDLTILFKDEVLQYHLIGTDFYQPIQNKILTSSKKYWNQELISENEQIYRSCYLAYSVFKEIEDKAAISKADLAAKVKEKCSKDYASGYVKGVHDTDAIAIAEVLLDKYNDLGTLSFAPEIRGWAQLAWKQLSEEKQSDWKSKLKHLGEIYKLFPQGISSKNELILLGQDLEEVFPVKETENNSFIKKGSQFLYKVLGFGDDFIVSKETNKLKIAFEEYLKKSKAKTTFTNSLKDKNSAQKISLATQWISAFLGQEHPKQLNYTLDVVYLLLYASTTSEIVNVSPNQLVTAIKGSHASIKEGVFNFNYHEFIQQLEQYVNVDVPAFKAYGEAKHTVTEELKEALKLNEFKPRVLSSFVRNKLIDQVYLPLFGDNLAKQLGTVGDQKRTDRMGMLLLISPPGYGKTTLMEYMANRLGLIFMKINGPAIGHEVTSVDPMTANNSAAKQELKKLNLAFEMGNNVMLYLDDIQHCNPEFLQKFISLADGTRKIEGVFEGKPKTYDLRSKKFCVIMAGNPYTESGDKFQIPDMLANRADIYNLGDIIGDTADLFKLSLIENALTSNPVLQQLSSKNFDDLYTLIDAIAQKNSDTLSLKGNHTNQEISEYKSVLEKVLMIRDTVLKVNETYIKSAAMEDAYRTEPSFKLQGSYRDMNKLVAKVVPIMNSSELQTLLLSHYENESQTLTSAAEANLLKYKELVGTLDNEEVERWSKIKTTYSKNNKLKGLGKQNEMTQVLAQMMAFSENLQGIQDVLKKGLDNG